MDIVLSPLMTGENKYVILEEGGNVRQVTIEGYELGLGSWIEDYIDALRFGF